MSNTDDHTRIFIGLDPGVQTGLAVWNAIDQRFDVLTTTTFWAAINTVETYRRDGVVVVIEAPGMNRSTFAHDISLTMEAVRRREKISRNVGQNIREATLLADGLTRRGYQVQRTRPRSGKLDAAPFKRLTGYKGRTSQHARDAGMLVFGLKHVPVELVSNE